MSQLLACGLTSEGQLGLGGIDEQQIFSPVEVPHFSSTSSCIRSISSGAQHSLFLLKDGSVYSCGNNNHGQLGRDGPLRRPGLVDALRGLCIRQIACGACHSLALADDGRLFSFGSNEHGQLAQPTVNGSNGSSQPMEVNLSDVVEVACGAYHSLALAANGTLYTWGDNRRGQLGLGSTQSHAKPEEVRSLLGVPIKMLAAGANHSVILSVSSSVFSFGAGDCCGVGDGKDYVFPVHVKALRHQKIEGRLFTFGIGASGRLGHDSENNETLPKQVTELMGSKISHVACGRYHTLVLVGHRVLAFGRSASGQLGLGNKESRLVPTVIQSLKHLNADDVFAGGDQSFVLCSSNEHTNMDWTDAAGNHQQDAQILRIPLRHLTFDGMEALLQAEPKIRTLNLERIFSSAACLNCSFLKPGISHFGASKNNLGVNMDHVMEGMRKMEQAPDSGKLTKLIGQCLEWAVMPDLTRTCTNPPDIEALRVYAVLPWCHVFSETESYFRKLHVPLATALCSLPKVALQVLRSWWVNFETRHFNRLLRLFKNVVLHVLDLPALERDKRNLNELQFRTHALEKCLHVMALLNQVNLGSAKVPYDSFYVTSLDAKVDIQQDYVRFMRRKDDNHQFAFCDYPFIFDAAVKSKLLRFDALIQMQSVFEEAQRMNFQSLFAPFVPEQSPYLDLYVRRAFIVEDTLTRLNQMASLDLKKPMRVKIAGEEADDMGGVRKEFFMLLFQELLDIKYGMFDENPESKLLWFSAYSFEDPGQYQLVGQLCGLAIYNGVLINLPFPTALYKKLLLQKVTLDDLKELSPTEGKSLEALLDYEGDDFEDVFCLTFEIAVSSFGHTETRELKAGGSRIAVTSESRQEYVDLYVNFKLVDGVREKFDSFAAGFNRVMTSSILKFFQPLELMEMVVGNESYEWDEFEKNAEYAGEYWKKHPVILMFWRVFHSLTLDEKKKFLRFLTGTVRIPLQGMKQVKIVIQPTHGGNDYFPVAHTCFNLLDLPKYNNEDSLRRKLLEAIEHTEGFTLV